MLGITQDYQFITLMTTQNRVSASLNQIQLQNISKIYLFFVCQFVFFLSLPNKESFLWLSMQLPHRPTLILRLTSMYVDKNEKILKNLIFTHGSTHFYTVSMNTSPADPIMSNNLFVSEIPLCLITAYSIYHFWLN